MTTLQKIDITDNRGVVHTIRHIKRIVSHKDGGFSVQYSDNSTDRWYPEEFSEMWVSEDDEVEE